MTGWRIQRVSARGFRNLEDFELAPGPRFNVIHGDNGAGKSNLLELLYYVSNLRSFRGARTEDLIRRGRSEAAMTLRVEGAIAPRDFEVRLSRDSRRTFVLDGKRPRSIATWQCATQAVLFHPGDLKLAGGAPETRRAFVDGILEQLDPVFANSLAVYAKALRSRNRLLRAEPIDERAVRAYDSILATSGSIVAATRERLAEEIEPIAERAFSEVVDESIPLSVAYEPRVEPSVDGIMHALTRAWNIDRVRRTTTEGPHRDDILLRLRNEPARHFASQGQLRAIGLSLKIAELEVLRNRTRVVPLLLLDDVSSELDRSRNLKLFQVLDGLGGQVFLTTTHPEFILLDRDRTDWSVCRGRISRSNSG